MLDRHFLGDVALALVLAIPLAALSIPDHVQPANPTIDVRPVSLLH